MSRSSTLLNTFIQTTPSNPSIQHQSLELPLVVVVVAVASFVVLEKNLVARRCCCVVSTWRLECGGTSETMSKAGKRRESIKRGKR